MSSHSPGALRRGLLGATALAALTTLASLSALPATGAAQTATEPRTAAAASTSARAADLLGRPSLPLQRRADDRPNIVVVMADDMRVDDLRFAPTISRVLGEGGVRVENSFSPYPLCCPARASFLTGQYAHNHGVLWHDLRFGFGSFDDSSTLATSVQGAGYNTGFVGKYLNQYGIDTSLVTGEPSFDYVPAGWTDWAGAPQRPPRGERGHRLVQGGPYSYFKTDFNVNGRIDRSFEGAYNTDAIGDLSRAMIQRYHRAGAPFLVYSSYVAPHHGGPFEPDDPGEVLRDEGAAGGGFSTPARPEEVKGRFDDVVTHAPGLPADGGSPEADVSDKPGFLAASPDLREDERAALLLVARQRAEAVAALDEDVAETIETLRRTREWRDTVMVVTSDNGFFLGEHRIRTGKTRSHEPALRVPLLIAGPGLPAGESRYDPMSTVDLTATLLDAADAPPPAVADGTSRWDSLRRGDEGWTTPVVNEAALALRPTTTPAPTNPDGDPETPAVQRPAARPGPVAPPTREEQRTAARLFPPDDVRTSVGLRTAQYSFTVYENGEGELYDLDTDAAQLENRWADPLYAPVRDRLTRLWEHYRSCAARECRRPLPQWLQRTPAENARATQQFWSDLTGIYGPQR